MNVFSKFDEIPSMILEVIKETKRYGHTVGRTDGWTDGHSDNVKTVYPPTNTVCGGIIKQNIKLKTKRLWQRMYVCMCTLKDDLQNPLMGKIGQN